MSTERTRAEILPVGSSTNRGRSKSGFDLRPLRHSVTAEFCDLLMPVTVGLVEGEEVSERLRLTGLYRQVPDSVAEFLGEFGEWVECFAVGVTM